MSRKYVFRQNFCCHRGIKDFGRAIHLLMLASVPGCCLYSTGLSHQPFLKERTLVLWKCSELCENVAMFVGLRSRLHVIRKNEFKTISSKPFSYFQIKILLDHTNVSWQWNSKI